MLHALRLLPGGPQLAQLCALLALWLLGAGPAPAQTITQAEYFFGADPGYGQGTPIPVTAPAPALRNLTFTANVAGLSAGFHQLAVRSRDAAGSWSLPTLRSFYYEAAAPAAPNVTRVEYFIDTDPGFGNGTGVPLTPAPVLTTAAFTADVSGLGAGFHRLCIRSRDAAGRWSLTAVRSFYYEPALAAVPNVTRVEYFIDTDPGFGNGISVPVVPGPDLARWTFSVDVGALANGPHRLLLRARDAAGRWSLVQTREFEKTDCSFSANYAAGLPAGSYAQSPGLPSAQLAFNSAAGSGQGTLVSDNTFIQADFGSPRSVSELRLALQAQAAVELRVEMQTSADLSAWTTAATYTVPLDGGQVYLLARALPTPAANVRGVRIQFQSALGPLTSPILVNGAGVFLAGCPPTISSFTPTGGAAGTSVVVTGTNLTGATGITFGGAAATGFAVNGAGTQLTVAAPAGGSTGPICVTTPAGSACSASSYTYPPAAPSLALTSAGPQQICAGNPLGLSFAVGGAGLPPASTITAQLSDAGGSFTSPTVIGSTAFGGVGTGVVQVTVPASAVAGSQYRVRLVSPNPVLTSNESGLWTIISLAGVTAASNSPVQAGATIQLTAGGVPAGAVLQWSGPNGFASAQPSPQIPNATTTAAGTYTLTVSQAGCSVQRTLSVSVVQNLLYTGQFAGTFCPGSSLSVPYTTQGTFATPTDISAYLFDAAGPPNNGTIIGTVPNVSGTNLSGSIPATIPLNARPGRRYRIVLMATDGSFEVVNDNGSDLTIQGRFTWTGGTSSDWFDARNWSCGQVPTRSSTATIASGPFQPVVTGSGAEVETLSIEPGAALQVVSALRLYGNVSNYGTWSGAGQTIFAGSGTHTISGPVPLQLGGVVINAGATLRLTQHLHVAGNWVNNGVFDAATNTVVFNGTTPQTVAGTGQLRFNGLTVQNTAGLSVDGPVYLRGNLMNNGRLITGSHPWYCVGTAAQTLGGTTATPIRFHDLLIQNPAGVTLTSAYGVSHVLTLTSGNLASNGHLTLHSSATGTAMVVNPAGGGVVTGRATMERFITGAGSSGYRHYASPMQLGSATVSEFADDLPRLELNPAYNTQGNTVSPFPTFFQYEESRLNAAANGFDQGWMVPTAADNLQPGRGYSAQTAPTTTVDVSGLLQNGTLTVPLTRGGQAGSGWNLLGNPYPAPIDWDLVPASPGVDKALYVFAPSGPYTGAYQSYVNGIGQNGGSKDVAAMQGFFVRATAASATLSLSNAVRHTSYLSPTFNRAGAGTTTKPLVRLEARNAQGQADEAVLYFEPQAGQIYQPGFDAYKVQLNGSGRPSLWSQAGNDALSINGLPDLATAGVVPLGVRVSQAGQHTLVLTAQHLPAGTQIMLEDRLLGRQQNLALDSVYQFTMHPDSVRQRFYLWLQPRLTAAAVGQLQASVSLYPNPTAGAVTLTVAGLRAPGAVPAEVLNFIGQQVRTLSLPVRQGLISQELNLRELPAGVYTLRLHTAEGTLVRRLVKQ
ncbi:T9SS type A sorting domain-containing protein [Hymenobacter sp. B81]|uniref:T9SS type A sorting domain-containing protein n=1 Tax=Hymenobacter sp. B81 TaxID=3344878 RepID=UPI0037DCE6E3